MRALVLAVGISFALMGGAACDRWAPVTSPVPTTAAAVTRYGEPGDEAIGSAVTRGLSRDPASVLLDVVVVSNGGIVTLTGDVQSALGHRRAVAIAKTVRGVRAVIDRTTLVPAERPDGDVARDVDQALATDPVTRGRDLRQEVAGDVVRVRGVVESVAARGAVLDVVARVLGVAGVVDEIRVAPRAPSDSELAEVAARVLRDDPWLRAPSLDLTARSGVVRLSGSLGAPDARERAIADARFAGARSVDTTAVRIDPATADPIVRSAYEQPPSDAQIQSAVENALVLDPRAAPLGVRVSVLHGIVTLRGMASSEAARAAAADDAAGGAYVRGVNDQIVVRAPPARIEHVGNRGAHQ